MNPVRRYAPLLRHAALRKPVRGKTGKEKT